MTNKSSPHVQNRFSTLLLSLCGLHVTVPELGCPSMGRWFFSSDFMLSKVTEITVKWLKGQQTFSEDSTESYSRLVKSQWHGWKWLKCQQNDWTFTTTEPVCNHWRFLKFHSSLWFLMLFIYAYPACSSHTAVVHSIFVTGTCWGQRRPRDCLLVAWGWKMLGRTLSL